MTRFIIISFLLFASSVFAFVPPDDRRLPAKKELSDDYRQHLDVELVKTSGYLNGDLKLDTTLILVSTKFQGDGLFVYLSNLN
jgi:hypothetical protein